MQNDNSRLAASLGVIGLLILVLIGAVTWKYYGYFDEGMTNQAYYEQKVSASLASVTIRNKLANLVSLARDYASDADLSKSVQEVNTTTVRADLRKVYLAEPHDYFVDFVLALDAEGRVLGGYPIAPQLGSKDQLFSGGASFKDTYVSGVLQREDGRTNYIAFVSPINSKTGSVLGYVELQVPLNLFSDFGKNIDPASTGFSYYIDQKGKLIAHPKFESDGPIIDYSNVPAVKELMSGTSESGEFYNPVEKVMRIAVYQKIAPYGWGVVTTAPVSEVMAERNNLLNQVLAYGVLAGILNVIIMVGIYFRLKQ